MKLALWTPAPAAAWAAGLAAELGPAALELVTAEPGARPAVELDLYHLASGSEHGFVYRALVERPGVVLLAEWSLHALVHAETAGRGDAAGYLREARHAHGDTGVFVARQVLRGVGGELPRLVAMNQRVLEHALALAAFSEELHARAAARLPDRPVVLLRADAAARDASQLRDLARELAPHAQARRRAILEAARAEASPRGLALDELAWSARELGLPAAPADAAALAASLFGARA